MQNTYSVYDITSVVIYFILCFVISVFIIRYYTKNNQLAWGIYIPLLYSFVILFFALCLVSVDLAAGLYKSSVNPDDGASVYLNIMWRVIYWSIQILAWIVLPICQTYPESGEVTILRKFLAAVLRYNY